MKEILVSNFGLFNYCQVLLLILIKWMVDIIFFSAVIATTTKRYNTYYTNTSLVRVMISFQCNYCSDCSLTCCIMVSSRNIVGWKFYSSWRLYFTRRIKMAVGVLFSVQLYQQQKRYNTYYTKTSLVRVMISFHWYFCLKFSLTFMIRYHQELFFDDDFTPAEDCISQSVLKWLLVF